MAETRAEKVERLAEQAVEKSRRDFTITKFGRHEDGYIHARVTPAGRKPIYVHCRYGSWMAPGTVGGRAMMKELEALCGTQLGREIKVELSRKARSLERAEKGGQNGSEPDADNGADAAPGDPADV